jgi:hypothetical protein
LLFESLNKRYGFSYLALEQDPIMMELVSAPSVVGNRESVISFARKYPNGFTFITDQELEMVAKVGSISNANRDRIWGLDQVFGAIHVLDQLIPFSPNQAVREQTKKLIGLIRVNELERLKNRIDTRWLRSEDSMNSVRSSNSIIPRVGLKRIF